MANKMRCSVFDELQAARDALKKSCEDFSLETSGNKLSMFKSKGKLAKVAANEKMLQLADGDFDDISNMVTGIESQWKQKHSKVSRDASCVSTEVYEFSRRTDIERFRPISYS